MKRLLITALLGLLLCGCTGVIEGPVIEKKHVPGRTTIRVFPSGNGGLLTLPWPEPPLYIIYIDSGGKEKGVCLSEEEWGMINVGDSLMVEGNGKWRKIE